MQSQVLGIDLGGTKVSAGVIDGEGHITGRARAKTKAWRANEEVFETIAGIAQKALARAGVEAQNLAAIGIGSPGPLDSKTGYIIESVNLNFNNFPLGPLMAERFGCAVIVSNDVDAGTYGEFKAGAARGASDVLGMFIGTGIGGGLILNGALYTGFTGNAGEIGHIVIEADGPRCGCGARGCLEALASRVAMTRDIKKAIKRGEKSSLAKLLDKQPGALRSSALRKAYDEGDKVVTQVIHNAARYIGIAVGSVVNLLGPEIIVLGGGMIEAMSDDFIHRIDRAARKVVFESIRKDVNIARSALGDDAGIIGAAMLAREVQQEWEDKKTLDDA